MGHEPKHNLTQTIVGAALKRTPDGKFAPKAPLRDHEVGGLLLVVGIRTATWCVDYKPHGTREDGRRHSKVRMTLGDATMMPFLTPGPQRGPLKSTSPKVAIRTPRSGPEG